jgi:hypothetical protein
MDVGLTFPYESAPPSNPPKKTRSSCDFLSLGHHQGTPREKFEPPRVFAS